MLQNEWPSDGRMRENLKKIGKAIFFAIMFLIMAGCLGILVCALNPSLTAMLAEKVESLSPAPGGNDGMTGMGGQGDTNQPAAVQPGINTDWLQEGDSPHYEIPGTQPVETPASVSGKTGYEPVQEEAEQIAQEEADQLTDSVETGDTGSGLTFDRTFYPYYAMLEGDMRQLYSQIYANAMDLNATFAPVVSVSVEQLKSVFEAVYNDHPELFWLETGYSCKYLRNGGCVEITLKYNSTVNDFAGAEQQFEGEAEKILAGAGGLNSALEKEKYVHDALMQRAEYDMSAPMNQSAYSALVGGKSVCAGYARAFQYLMQQLGIPCYYCTGYAGEDHAWNIINIDGRYYNVDVTWDDTDSPTYDYYNRTDREFADTHMRTGLSVYLPACVSDDDRTGESDAAASGNGEGALSDSGSGEEESGNANHPGTDLSDLINPNPIQPMEWQSRTPADTGGAGQTAEEKKQESLEKAGITEEQVRDTLKEYYEDCRKLMKEVGKGDQQFSNVIPQSLWSSVESAYSTGDYWKGYVEGGLKDLGMENFAIQLQVEDLGGGYYRLYHNVLTY
ncbi:MAG: hypothetical protein HFH88_15185 [Lachnospiraceae bacterium]|nr:hypothetical protein [Lachnospiraceae bacterium]